MICFCLREKRKKKKFQVKSSKEILRRKWKTTTMSKFNKKKVNKEMINETNILGNDADIDDI